MNTLQQRPRNTSQFLQNGNGSTRVLAPVFTLILATLFVFTSSSTPAGERGALAIILGVLALILLSFSPCEGMPGILLYLCFLGGLRRWLIPIFGWPDSDPLLLVAPVVVVIYVVNLALRRMLPHDTQLSRQMPWLLGFMGLEIFNPLQGGLMIGLSGALFFIVPVLWYFVGQRIGTEILTINLFKIVICVAVLAAIYGLYQTWFGFTESEQQWMKIVSADYSALEARAFSFFTGLAEYAHFLGYGVVICISGILKGKRRLIFLLPLLGLAGFLTSSRGLMVSTLTTCTVLWAVQGRTLISWIPRGILALIIAIVGLVWSMQQVQNGSYSGQMQELVQHETKGLLDPLNPDHSTAQLHSRMVWSGIVQGFTNPLGRGLGATNLAGIKYSDNTPSESSDNRGNGSSEVDISNVFISLGFVGGLLYISIQFLVLKRAFQFWQRSRSMVALGLLAVLFFSLGQWTSIGCYAEFTLDWFCIGALDKLEHERFLASSEKSS